ncbi:MAG: protein kinase [Vicinamibacteria bacterium]
MKCPSCQSDVQESADHCFNCGHVLRSSTTLIRGSVIGGRYEILAPLGKGGMGMVYKARDHTLEETVAVKVLRSEIAADLDMERRFRTEIRLARKVRHRNVCGIHEYGEEGGLRYIVMEYIEGVDLRKVLTEHGALPPEVAFDTCIHVAEGLQAIHDAGIVHRDLKTANLMRDGHGVVRLMDFGIAKQVGEGATLGATATGLVVGTPEYMSPEQAQGGKIDHRSDIYALGIVAFEVFTGHVPFKGETPIATIFKHLQEPPPLEGPEAPTLPPSVVPVLKKALAKKADDRFSSCAEFAQAMTAARDAAGIAPLPSGPMTPRPSPAAPTVQTPRTLMASSTAASAPTVATPRPAPRTGASKAISRVEPTRVMPPPKAARSGVPIGAVVGVAVLVLAVGVGAMALLLRRPTPAATPTPGSAPTEAPAVPPAAATGTLVIDALPWGEVVLVTDSKGGRHEPSSARFTPLSLALPPGDYTVEVRNPSFPKPLSTSVSVRAAAVETRLLEFRRIDASDYLKRAGL